jgi:hypothetical protein
VGYSILTLDGGIYNLFWTLLPDCTMQLVLHKGLVIKCIHSLTLRNGMTHKNTFNINMPKWPSASWVKSRALVVNVNDTIQMIVTTVRCAGPCLHFIDRSYPI